MGNLFHGLWVIITSPIGVVLTMTAIWHLVLWEMKIPFNVYTSVASIFIDIIVVFVLYDRWVHFFSRFVLPIRTAEERNEIYRRVNAGADGPALFIRNGQLVLREGEGKKRGRGVILVDTASAAVIRTDTEIKRTIGPGVTFTSKGEYVAGTVDLRTQFQLIGPIPGDQPFAQNTEFNKEYVEVQRRRQETSGLTRDGFEVVPTISIRFSVQKPDADDQIPVNGVISRYGFDPKSVERAIVRKMVQIGSGDRAIHLPWNRLPAHLTINLWREYVRKFKFSELFTSDKISGLQTIEDMVNLRLKELNVVELSDTGIPTGGYTFSPEAECLFDRGIQVDRVKLHCLYFDSALEEGIIQAWETDWYSNARKEQKQLEEWEALVDTSAREEALKSFAELASRPFSMKPRVSTNPYVTLQLLFQEIRGSVIADHNIHSNLEDEIRRMDDFIKWLQENNA
jgi:hypothetical protein